MHEPADNIVIIGGGLGGLMCGAILTKEGHQVTVVEKNAQIGGGLQSYTRFGETFDTGMHIFGGMQADGNIRALCDYLGITSHFNTLPLDATNDVSVHIGEDFLYNMNFTEQGLRDCVSSYFPEEKENIEQYIRDVTQVTEELDLFSLRPDRSDVHVHSERFMMEADKFVNQTVRSKELRAILTSLNMLYAGEQGVSPAYLHSVIARIFMNGACRVTGGYSNFAKALANCIISNGGEVLTCEEVCHVETSGSSVTGVATSKGKFIEGSIFISAIPPLHTIEMLDTTRGVSKVYRELLKRQMPSQSAFIINAKLRPQALEFENKASFFVKDTDSSWATDETCRDITRFMFMTSPDTIGNMASSLTAVVPMKWESVREWQDTRVGQRGEEYLKFKKIYAEKVLGVLGKIRPEITSAIEAIDTSTPLTIRDYTGVDCGAMCGYRKVHDDILSFLPVSTRLSNLYMTGQSINMHGFCGVSMTAIQTCETILGKNSIRMKIAQNTLK